VVLWESAGKMMRSSGGRNDIAPMTRTIP